MKFKNSLGVALLAGALLSAGPVQAQDKGTVGVSMPTKSSARWISDGDSMVKSLAAKGYKADLQYADDDIPNQLAQVENMITKKVKVLVIAAIDGTTLSNALQKAADAGVKVIAYDRLIKGSKNVDYYATFDNFQVGVLQASSIVDKLGLKQGKGPFNIELFGGSPDDNNAFFFYDGAMSVLKPYIDSGKLVVRSKQMGMDKVGTLRWDGAVAQARMDNLLSAFYGNARVDAVLSPYDGLSIGILSSLKGVGYGTPKQPIPVVSGQDAEVASVKSMLRGEQSSTVFKDTRELAKVTVNMIDEMLSGKKVDINDTKTYNNGVKVVPSYGGSDTLAAQITQGAPVDVFAAASTATMGTVTKAGDGVGTPQVFAKNELEIAVSPSNPDHIASLADVTKSGVKLALCAATVPCGAAATKAFAAAKLTPHPVTLEQDVASVLTKVELGEVDAGMVYQTDVKSAGSKVLGVNFTEAASAINTYPIVVLKTGKNPTAAQAFVNYVVSRAGQQILQTAGFEQP